MAFGGDVYTLPGNKKKIKQHNKKKTNPDGYAESTERHTIHVTEWKKTTLFFTCDICAEKEQQMGGGKQLCLFC